MKLQKKIHRVAVIAKLLKNMSEEAKTRLPAKRAESKVWNTEGSPYSHSPFLHQTSFISTKASICKSCRCRIGIYGPWSWMASPLCSIQHFPTFKCTFKCIAASFFHPDLQQIERFLKLQHEQRLLDKLLLRRKKVFWLDKTIESGVQEFSVSTKADEEAGFLPARDDGCKTFKSPQYMKMTFWAQSQARSSSSLHPFVWRNWFSRPAQGTATLQDF